MRMAKGKTRAAMMATTLALGVVCAPEPAAAQPQGYSGEDAEMARLRATVEALQQRLAAVEAQLAATPSSTAPSSTAPLSTTQSASSSPGGAGTLVAAASDKPTEANLAKAAPAAPSEGFRVGSTTIRLTGFIKGDMMFSRYNNGDTATNPLGRDFALPQSIPVGGRRSGVLADASAKQTRFSLLTSTPVAGNPLTTLIEMDFQVAPGTQGTERSLNAYNLGLRRAVMSYRGFSAGQDWSNFQFTPAQAETADFLGINEGTVFVRQMMLRYARPLGGGLTATVSLENPETVTTTPTTAVQIENDDDSLPDLIARLGWKAGKADLSVAGVVRAMRVDPSDGRGGAHATGWGVSAAGVVPVPTGKGDDIRFMVTGGRGIGRYVGVTFASDAIYTPVTNALRPIGVVAGFVAGRHFWASTVRSTVMGSFQSVDNPAIASPLSNRLAWSLATNLFVTPLPRLDLGVEFRHTVHELENRDEGSLDRLQFTVKQGF